MRAVCSKLPVRACLCGLPDSDWLSPLTAAAVLSSGSHCIEAPADVRAQCNRTSTNALNQEPQSARCQCSKETSPETRPIWSKTLQQCTSTNGPGHKHQCCSKLQGVAKTRTDILGGICIYGDASHHSHIDMRLCQNHQGTVRGTRLSMKKRVRVRPSELEAQHASHKGKATHI